jgi:hypothetical protein
MSPPLPDAQHDWVHGGQQEPDTGYENHSIAMHKAASDKVPLALLVPAVKGLGLSGALLYCSTALLLLLYCIQCA